MRVSQSEAKMVPPIAQAALWESYQRSLRLFVAYGVLMGWIQIR